MLSMEELPKDSRRIIGDALLHVSGVRSYFLSTLRTVGSASSLGMVSLIYFVPGELFVSLTEGYFAQLSQ